MVGERLRAVGAGLLTGGLLLTAAGCAGAPPQITSLSPSNGSHGVPADEPLRVTFDHSVDKASVPGRFRIEPGLSCDLVAAFTASADAPCRVLWSADATSFTLLHTGALFQPELKYKVHLDPGVRDLGGAANSLDHTWELTVASAPVVRTTSPGDGATAVPLDSPLSVTFSSPMSVTPTVASIQLTPAVPGTRVVVNSLDHSRFVILPGRLLTEGGRYSVTVGATAADEHGQPMAAPAVVRFTAGGAGGGGHALVLARARGQLPSVLILARGGPDQVGEPTGAVTLLTAPRCLVITCSAVGEPTVAYLEAALSPAGDRLAVVERDLQGAALDRLVLLDIVTLRETTLATGAAHPSWSPDGGTLAFGVGNAVELANLGTGTQRLLPAGDPLDAPPVWSADGTSMALQVRPQGQPPHVELADPVLQARYPVPGLGPGSSSPALSPSGDRLAVRVDPPAGAVAATGTAATPGTWVVRVRDGSAPQLLSSTLTPLAWADPGTLLGVDRGPAVSSLARVTVAGGDTVALATGPRDSDLSTVVADPAARRVSFLQPDATGRLQAWAVNGDGSNLTQLTSLTSGDDLEAVAVSLGG